MKVLKFGAIWCPECLVMKPMWAEIEKEVPGFDAEFYDADEHPEKLEEYGIKDIPVFVFLDQNGKELMRLEGLQNKDYLIQIVKENINK